MKRARQAPWIVFFALIGVVAWGLLRPWLPRAELAETNYQANLIRLQAWSAGGPKSDVIVGSSIAGRLLPSYFRGTSLDGIASLALDGSGPELGIKLVLAGDNPPSRIFVEVHRLGKPWHPNDDALLAAVQDPGFALARMVPAIRAETRPTTLLYAWLKGSRDKAASAGKEMPSGTMTPEADPSWRSRFREQVAELRGRGCEVILLRLPVGRENPRALDSPNETDFLASELGLRLLDLNIEAMKHGLAVTYTDGLHLTPSSARQVSQLLAESAAAPGE